ncbi:hypothetical protein P170DRAFT_512466 [Aspergillus steynii IBT 23096]|uniref:Uncharacterized protein n=1 Tax=Aspergillus steynii IBT 23096 TaxID=1392250 RepID=A0A2I2FYZ2_9EURO|nr:uncharacterized protein P170DRAFT_512466 [Aspergillus steynii IBT 23096]PLB45849.1 hypothetical protein P170DRAFT_512466 [Aspergillus steynii IBT 23096]
MSADKLLYQMDLSSHQNEWYDFDNFFEFPSGDLDSNSTSVDSVSPKDFELGYSEADATNWNSNLGACSQAPFPELVDYENPFGEYTLGTEPIANPNEILQLPSSSEAEGLVGSTYDSTWSPDFPGHDEQFYSTIRQMVESQAATDAGYSSKKEKRIEASIALHMQRLQDVSLPDLDLFSDSNTSFPSPCWSETARPNASVDGSPATTLLSEPTSKSPTPPSTSDAAAGGMELVLDLNMNTAANVPKKQKPRSRAQKENYIKARKYGACEKHRKQHKRCNCLEVNISRVDMAGSLLSTTPEVLRPAKYAQQLHVRGQDHDRLVLQTRMRQSNTQQSVQSASLVDRNDPSPVVSSPESSTTRHSPCHAQRPVSSSDLGRTLQVRSPVLEIIPRRNVGHVSSTGLPATQTVQESPTASFSQHTSRIRRLANRGSPELGAVIHGHDHDQLLSQGLLQRWRTRPTTRTGQESVQPQTVQHTPGSRVSSNDGLAVQWRLPVLSVCAGLYNTVLAFSQFWQKSASVTSWAGNLLERFLVVSSKQFWHVRKGWGLN